MGRSPVSMTTRRAVLMGCFKVFFMAFWQLSVGGFGDRLSSDLSFSFYRSFLDENFLDLADVGWIGGAEKHNAPCQGITGSIINADLVSRRSLVRKKIRHLCPRSLTFGHFCPFTS